MARREDYILCRSLLTDGSVTAKDLSNILLKWHEDSPKSLLQTILDDSLISEEEGRGVMMCVSKLAEQKEIQSNYDKIDFIFCQATIKRELVSPEVVNAYRRKIQQNNRSGLCVSEALLKDGHINASGFIELKKAAENVFYHRKIVALARGKEKLAEIFQSPSRDEKPTDVSSKIRAGVQKVVIDARAEDKIKLKKRRTSNLPKIFGQYEIIEEIASGGMGTVYKARQIDLDRIVALKVLHEEEETPDRIKRFLREAEAANRLKHPNIVGIHEVGKFKNRHFFSMDYIEGVPLSILIQKTKNVELEDLLNIVAELAKAISYAHKQEIIHRDLKPANIIIDMDGHPQITDFGLAKILDTQSRLTKSDTIIGTPFYMAPEQTRGENHKIDGRTDVWGLGIILYEMITKKLPFVGRSSIELYHKINNLEPIPPSKISPSLPKELDYITLHAIAKDPQDRYLNAEQLADDIDRYLDGKELIIKDPPRWVRYIKRFYRHHKWFILTAILAIVLGWFCGWYLLNKLRN